MRGGGGTKQISALPAVVVITSAVTLAEPYNHPSQHPPPKPSRTRTRAAVHTSNFSVRRVIRRGTTAVSHADHHWGQSSNLGDFPKSTSGMRVLIELNRRSNLDKLLVGGVVPLCDRRRRGH